MAGLKKVMRFFAETPADCTFALAEFAEFKNFVDVNQFSEASLSNVFSKDFWQLHGAQWPHLQPICIRVFSVGTSSSTSERNFSTWSHIWSNKANSMKFDTAVNLVYIYFNLRALKQYHDSQSRSVSVTRNWLTSRIEEQEVRS